MSVPLDRLYNFLQDICNQDVLIYRFLPHGSRKIEDCLPLVTPNYKYLEKHPKMQMVCHDQETLDYKSYEAPLELHSRIDNIPYPVFNKISKHGAMNYYDKILLLHSEMRSKDLEWFENNGAVGVYWWSHAMIARDWYRYAKSDPLLDKEKNPTVDFLIYNRAWTGLREYRLKFIELILEQDLQSFCQMHFNPYDNHAYYKEHEFCNPAFNPSRDDLCKHFSPTTANSTASADYSNSDYQNCAIEVVLETVFDDTKWHLTEKVLRPIACGVPFILASTAGSLQYLQHYGFKTFHDYFDESYDTIQDPVQRLECIVNLMKQLSKLTPIQKQQLYSKLQPICDFNRQRFFSNEFYTQVVEEFTTNFTRAYKFVKQGDSHKYFDRYMRLKKTFFNDV
tara:strand:+ start:2795 stop:3976 length:1182 start_codon:yes stop_codon:yes gene_type:complete